MIKIFFDKILKAKDIIIFNSAIEIPENAKVCFADLDGVFWPENSGFSLFSQPLISNDFLDFVQNSSNQFDGFIVITNQTAIARGNISRRRAISSTKKFLQKTEIRNYIFAISICTHHQNASKWRYRKFCQCRKPEPGAIQFFLRKHKLLTSDATFVGDRITDAEAASRAKIHEVFLLNNSKIFTKNEPSSKFTGLIQFKLVNSLSEILTSSK
jgi:histidinol phosphatase-like enzyme